ncbi:hypothetical protein ACFV9C_42085 [Kribbella sp. NPDC059898]
MKQLPILSPGGPTAGRNGDRNVSKEFVALYVIALAWYVYLGVTQKADR